MATVDELIARIEAVFPHASPGDRLLRVSTADEEIAALLGATDWRTIDPALLDGHYDLLGVLAEASLRFLMPAYIVADLRDQLLTADPVFALVHGFSEFVMPLPDGGEHRSGGATLLGPARYGALTWDDMTRHRLSVFTREESAAIVAYLEHRRDADTLGVDGPRIAVALDAFWNERARVAPTAADLAAVPRFAPPDRAP